MKISHLNTYIVAVPPPHLGGRYWIFVELETACGIKGVGEIYSATFHPNVVKQMVEDVFERYLFQHDPHHIERFWRQCYSSGFTQRPDLSMMGVVSGLEMACWDIIGKAANKPVYELLGGRVHEALRSYTYLYPQNTAGEYDYDDPYLAAEYAAEMVLQGFTAIKFDPAGPYTAYSGHHISMEILERADLFCRLIREAVGNKADLLFGTHGQMVPASAIRLAKRLEQYEPLWFEEPVPPGQVEAMAEVAQHTSIPIAAGERLTTKYEFFSLLQAGAASIVQLNVGRVGGLLEAKKIATLAEVYYAQIAPHLYNGPIGAAASIQLATCTPNFLMQECIQNWQGFHNQILKTPLVMESGFMIPPTAPGLGVELNLIEIQKYMPYTGQALHLQMAEKPFDVRNLAAAKG